MAVSATSLASDLSVRPATDEAMTDRSRNELFRFRFGTEPADDVADAEAIFRLHIDPIGPPAPDEIWYTNGAVRCGTAGDFVISESDDYIAAHIEMHPYANADFKDLTTRAYRDLLQLIQERGYPHLIRAWNYFPGINTGDDDLELYRQFTAGRAVAFEEFAYQGETMPAGTAIGTDEGTPFTVSALATRERCRMVENPQQVSAYQYPREYGPSSPSFSRAVVVASMSGYRILISGTASIVGHQSMFLGDSAQQTTQTLRNLDELIQQARHETQTQNSVEPILSDGSLRIYVRRTVDVPDIERALRDYPVDDPDIVFLRGDICRRELLLEIEAAGGI